MGGIQAVGGATKPPPSRPGERNAKETAGQTSAPLYSPLKNQKSVWKGSAGLSEENPEHRAFGGNAEIATRSICSAAPPDSLCLHCIVSNLNHLMRRTHRVKDNANMLDCVEGRTALNEVFQLSKFIHRMKLRHLTVVSVVSDFCQPSHLHLPPCFPSGLRLNSSSPGSGRAMHHAETRLNWLNSLMALASSPLHCSMVKSSCFMVVRAAPPGRSPWADEYAMTIQRMYVDIKLSLPIRI